MYRRDVLKSLATLPFALALRKSTGETQREHHFGTLEVHLDGAFAVVIQEHKENSILAFSPRPPKDSEQHEFFFNGTKAGESGKERTFKLSVEKSRHKPEINAGLNDFLFRTNNWRVGDSIATLEFPAPDRITFSGHRTRVQFKNDHTAFMPTNRILEYDLHGPANQALACSESDFKCEPSDDSYDKVKRYFFEVGPKHSLNREESRSHAIKFFNFMLEQSFPDLAKQDLLRVPGDERKQSSMLVPAILQPQAHDSLRRDASYIVECEFGGPVIYVNAPHH